MSRTRSVVRRLAGVVLAFALLAVIPSCGVGGILAGSAGGGGGGGGDTRPPRPPRVTLIKPATDPASNAIPLAYELNDPQEKDAASRPPGSPDPRVQIFPEWRFAGSETWRPMTESRITDSDGTRNLSLTSHTFVWNTVIDLGGLIARVRARFRAEYEPAAGINRRFRTKEIEFIVDNRLASTVFGDDVTPRSDVDTFPVDLAASGTVLLVASTGAGIVEVIDELGRVRRVVGVGIPGDAGDGGDPGVARLEDLSAVAIDTGGLVLTNVEDRIRVTNPFLTPGRLGSQLVPPRTIDTVAGFGGLTRARAVRVHPSGAILAIDNRSRILAFNPADPGAVGPPDITLAGVLIPPGAVGQICGGGASDADGLASTSTLITDATTLGIGPDGEIYYGEQSLGRVRVINPNTTPLSLPGGDVDPGTVQTVAGGNGLGFSGDAGPAVLAQLNRQDGLAVTPSRQLVIADTFNVRVRLVNLGVSDVTFVGTTVSPGDIDTIVGGGTGGVGSAARDVRLDAPNAVELGVPDALLIADGNTVIMVNAGAGTITAYGRTVLGGRTREIYDARERNGQPLRNPIAMHVEPSTGALFFTDASSVRVLNLSSAPDVFGGADVESGDVAVIAGGSVPGNSGDAGPARAAAFSNPGALATDGPFRLFVADTDNHRIRLVNIGDPVTTPPEVVGGVSVPAGFVNTVIGSGATTGPIDDGDGLGPLSAVLSNPQGLAVSGGLLFVADTGHHRVRCYNPGASDVTVAGTVVAAGTINTIYGDGTPGFTPDGAGPFATDTPTAITVDARGILYIAESGNARIRALNTGLTAAATAGVTLAGVFVPNAEVRTLVGTGVPGNFGDGGGGLDAEIERPRSLLVQALTDGTPVALYFADTEHHVVRVLNLTDVDIVTALDSVGGASITVPGGGIFTVAGGPNALGFQNPPGFDGDGEEAELVRFFSPIGIAISNQVLNNIRRPAHFFVADSENNRLRRFGAPPIVLDN